MKSQPIRIIALVLTIFLSISALYGGVMLVLDPTGTLLQMPPGSLADTPFTDYLIPGLILLVVIGAGSMAAFLVTLFSLPGASKLVTVTGVALLTWMTTQVMMVGGWHPIQIAYLAIGVMLLATGLLWMGTGNNCTMRKSF